jgi:hypothetical protein
MRMTMLVHLIDERNAASVKRSGLRGGDCTLRVDGVAVTLSDAVFAMPLLPDYFASHQWLRELKRGGMRTIAAAHFRQRADTLVWVGRFNGEHRRVPLGHAAGLIMREPDPRGWQVVLPQSVPAKAIHAVRSVPQVIGWRFFPESHDKAPWKCLCEFCISSVSGEPKSRAFLRRIAREPSIKPDDWDNPAKIKSLQKPTPRKATTRKRRADLEDA